MQKKNLATVLLTGALVGSLAACSGSGSPEPDSTDTAFALTTEVPAPVGDVDSVTWNIGEGEPDTLDPALSAVERVSTVVGNLCESLTRFEPGAGKPVPNLAESVTNPDDRTIVVDLRPDATFWNGNPVTPADVVYSAERVMDPATGSSWGDAFNLLESMEITGEHQVTFKLSTPSPLFEWYLATPTFAVLEKAFAEQAGAQFGTNSGGVMCSGPYQLDKWNAGQSIELSAYPDYWNADRLPKVKKATFTFNSDAASATASLLTGATDGQWNLEASGFPQLMTTDDGKLLFGASYSPVFLSGFASGPAMQFPEVRKALQMMFDRVAIADAVYGGAAAPIRSTVPPATWGYSQDIYEAWWEELGEPKYDLDQARDLLESVEGDIPPMVIAFDATSESNTTIAVALESAAKQVGLPLELRAMQPAEYYLIFSDDPTVKEGLDGYLVRGYLDFPEPLTYAMFRMTGHFYNFGGYSNAKYDSLLTEAQSTLDDDKRATLVTEALAIAAKDAYTVPLVTPFVNVFLNKSLTGVVPTQGFLYNSWLADLGAVG